jgi:hypothetical protein
MDELIKDGELIVRKITHCEICSETHYEGGYCRGRVWKIIHCELCGETHYEGGYCRGCRKARNDMGRQEPT